MSMSTKSLYFTGPRAVEIRTESLDGPGVGQVLLNLEVSGISAGTELNVFRGLAPQWRQAMDPATRLFSDANGSDWSWPARYGYAAVGRVAELGRDVGSLHLGDLVFAYVPHGQHAIVDAGAVVQLGDLDDAEIGVFVANLNTAYNGVLDANIPLGADVVVSGLGVIGQLVTRLLARNGARQIIAVDTIEQRRQFALAGGATIALDPREAPLAERVRELTEGRGADYVIEVSGAAPALNEAIRTVGFNGTVIAMSWYGGTFESLSLSGEFHHNRPRIISSQVGTVNPYLGPLWSLGRRGKIAREYLSALASDLKGIITHRVPLDEAGRGYDLLDQGSPEVMQVLIDYR
ncbi:zinc-dependent alcohol dehydrogenase [Devosia faecipullorum]|uniref:zinc-dependent alcohol dehydrogenase n=1 Tax=Devosia faecipullorum TaxID=2755039 RepID=UPI00187B311A|nr:zinc-binding alcohol dehydrogenase [Devosia faecipullorum]MBE7733741.1 zinc-binding alcohol dehydrogenase [Devosia faecipullorum]